MIAEDIFQEYLTIGLLIPSIITLYIIANTRFFAIFMKHNY